MRPEPGTTNLRGLLLVLSATICVIVSWLSATPAAAQAQRVELELGSRGRLVWDRGQTPALLVLPRRGDGWLVLARRLTGSSSTVQRLRRANPKLTQPLRDRRVRVPLTLLRADLRLEAVVRLFPTDQRVSLGWQHWVLDPFGGGEESWEWLAELFTGRRDQASGLRRVNPELATSGLRRGRPLVIPESQLLAVFRKMRPPRQPTPAATPTRKPAPSPTPTHTVSPSPTATRQPSPRPSHTPLPLPTVIVGDVRSGALAFGQDSDGEFAVYNLRQGEALYSAVVVRFTGQLHAEEVIATAQNIARRSGIDDVTSIPVGYPIKIPLDLLLPEHLPRNHPRRLAWIQDQKELARFVELVHATDLSGVHVILDAGHGGNDSGAVVSGIWEATYAYDVMCRIKANLERHTRATVWMTSKDISQGFRPSVASRLVQDRDRVLLTQPTCRLVDSTIGVHLRWYLTNDIILRRLGKKVPRSKTVFLSVHADSLHSSVRGTMAYVPSRYLRPDRYQVKLKALRGYAEYRSHPEVKLSSDFKARAEASSRHLAERIVASLRRGDMEVHPYEPIRSRVLRGKKSWVPAVLRYSLAQHAVLLECCNMANEEDRRLLLDSGWRERFARSVVEGMAEAFGP